MAQTRRTVLVATLLAALGLPLLATPQAAKPKPVQKPAGKANVIPGAALTLPSGGKVKARWVCPPLSRKAVEQSDWYNINFVVDANGRPWIGTGYADLINPTGGYKFVVHGGYDDTACLDSGVFLIATGSDLGFVVPPEKPKTDYNGVPMLNAQPISELPIPQCKLFAGVGSCLYLVGRNPSSKLCEVYLLRQEKMSSGSTGLREYVKVLSAESEIAAVTGDGSTTYVAIDRAILKSTGSGNSLTKVFVHPTQYIRSLAYSPQIGLFYASSSGVGYIGAKTSMQIAAVDDPDICLRNGSLYVLLSRSLGVLALDGVADLKRFDRPMKDVVATQSKEVKVTDIRFFEAGDTPPDYARRKYAREFEKTSTRFVYCQVDMVNLLKGKRGHKQVVSTELICPGPMGFKDSAETTLEFKPDTPSAWGWLRFGLAVPGWFYPGEYTVRTSLNGSRIDERRFVIRGEPDLLEAVNYSDTAKVAKLLKDGSDPNAISAAGQTPLTLAAIRGSLEIARLLLDHKADVNAKNSDGETPLLIAAGWHQENSAFVRLLIERGADVKAKGSDGQTALHKAARSNHVETMRLLLERKSDPNALDNDDATPLTSLSYDMPWSEAQATPESIELLVAHGANPNLLTAKGGSPLEKAVGAPSLLLTQTLLALGADVNRDYSYSDGTAHSLLYWAVISREITSDRLKRDEFASVARLLAERGANLKPDEVDYVLAKASDLLGRKQIAKILDNSNQTVFSYKPDDPWMRKYVLKRLMGLAYSNLSNARDVSYYKAALSCSVLAKDRAEEWGMASQVPEVYFNCGLMAAKLRNSADARGYLQKYIDLAPNALNASSAREMLSRL